MPQYNHVITITVPLAIVDIAKQLSRAFDPDVGGYEAFAYPTQDDNGAPIPAPDTVTYSSPCTADYRAAMLFLQTDPQALLESVQRDYAMRWPELTPPTLDDCSRFVSEAKIE